METGSMAQLRLALVPALLLLLSQTGLAWASQLSVGIVGSGIAGTVSAYWIRKVLGPDVNITL